MSNALSNKTLPVVALVLIAVVAVGISLWRGLTILRPPSAGRDIAVHPGMYNLRAELQKPRDPNRRRGADGPLPTVNGITRGVTP
jgi:hypothetical protein